MIQRRTRNRAVLNNGKKKSFFSQHIYILLVIVGMIALIVIIIILTDTPSDPNKKSNSSNPPNTLSITPNEPLIVPIDTSPSVEYYDQESGDIIDSSKINLNDYDIINP